MDKVSENPLKNRKLPPLVIIVALLVTFYLAANVMAIKLIEVFGITIFDAGTIVFPLTYMLGDVLTEIWGYSTAKRVIWLTFACEVLFTLFVFIGIFLPVPPENAAAADAYRQVFSFVPRIMVASLAAFVIGELTNAWFMVRIKEWTRGRHLWMRTIGSSVFGYLLDTTIFVCIAFIGTVPLSAILSMIVIQIAAKMLIEMLAATPMTYVIVGKLRKSVNP